MLPCQWPWYPSTESERHPVFDWIYWMANPKSNTVWCWEHDSGWVLCPDPQSVRSFAMRHSENPGYYPLGTIAHRVIDLSRILPCDKCVLRCYRLNRWIRRR